MRFLPSPSLPPKIIKYYPNCVEEWQLRVDGAGPLIYNVVTTIKKVYFNLIPAVVRNANIVQVLVSILIPLDVLCVSLH